MLRKRKKIDAIKLYRAAYHVGLKEAKDAVEQMEAYMQRETSEMVVQVRQASSVPSEPTISNNPFEDEAAGNRMRLVLTIAILLLALGGARFSSCCDYQMQYKTYSSGG